MSNNKKKYELTEEVLKVNGVTLYRIKALKSFSDVSAGDLGGFVEKDGILSHENNCWIYNKCWAYKGSSVSENAQLRGNVILNKGAHVCGEAVIWGDFCIDGDAHIASIR